MFQGSPELFPPSVMRKREELCALAQTVCDFFKTTDTFLHLFYITLLVYGLLYCPLWPNFSIRGSFISACHTTHIRTPRNTRESEVLRLKHIAVEMTSSPEARKTIETAECERMIGAFLVETLEYGSHL